MNPALVRFVCSHPNLPSWAKRLGSQGSASVFDLWRSFLEGAVFPNGGGPDAWLAVTIALLRRSGMAFELATTFARDRINVTHALACPPKDRFESDHFVLMCCGEFVDAVGHVRVFQNQRSAWNGGGHFVPHWPQPGLLPRDPARLETIKRMAYVGYPPEMLPSLDGVEVSKALSQRGIEFCRPGILDWHDYRNIDLVVGVRPANGIRSTKDWQATKPASKLINAWHAGVPAILGDELAYREVLKSPLDYLAVAPKAEAVLHALDRLSNAPEVYDAMVRNGQVRAQSFSNDRILGVWRDLLQTKATKAFSAWRDSPNRHREKLHDKLLGGYKAPWEWFDYQSAGENDPLRAAFSSLKTYQSDAFEDFEVTIETI